MSDELKTTRKMTSGNSATNALDYVTEEKILNSINTALPVVVTEVQANGTGGAGGYVTVRPLVKQVDANGSAVEQTDIFKLPFFRLQSGVAAIVVDPVVGDKGLAVFAQRDCSNLPQGESTDGVQVATLRHYSMSDGFYIGGFLQKKPTVWIEITQNGAVNITASGNVNVTGDVIADGISLKNHTHTCPHGGNTSAPN